MWASILPSQRSVRIVLGIAVAAHMLVFAVLVQASSVDIPGHGRFYLLQDDAMISMRYARNLAHGLGLVWNPGERVEGFTNPLWTIVMAVIHLLPVDERTAPLGVQVTNFVLNVLVIAASGALAASLVEPPGRTMARMLAIVGSAASAPFLLWSVAGFETTLQALFITVGLRRWVEHDLTGQPRPISFVLFALATLVRPDATVILAGALLISGMVLIARANEPWTGRAQRAVRAFGPGVVLAAAIYPARWWYYGDLLPNTYYLKVVGIPNRLEHGIAYVRSFLASGPGWIVLLVGLWTSRLREWQAMAVLALCVAQIAYVAYVGGDVFAQFRFFVPIMPALTALASAWSALIAKRARKLYRLQGAIAVLGALLFTVSSSLITFAYVGQVLLARQTQGRWSAELPVLQDAAGAQNTITAVFLREHASGSPNVAVFWAGVVPYITDWRAVDLLGKSDRYIAHENAAGAGAPGHSKWDFTYSLKTYAPDFVISAMTEREAADSATIASNAEGDFAFAGRLYSDPEFQAHYRANLVATPLSPEWLAVYRRDDSADTLARKESTRP